MYSILFFCRDFTGLCVRCNIEVEYAQKKLLFDQFTDTIIYKNGMPTMKAESKLTKKQTKYNNFKQIYKVIVFSMEAASWTLFSEATSTTTFLLSSLRSFKTQLRMKMINISFFTMSKMYFVKQAKILYAHSLL